MALNKQKNNTYADNIGKKFSDFQSINTILDNDIIAGERVGSNNINISYKDFANNIKAKLLKEVTTDLLVFKHRFCEHNAGIPFGYPKHLIYLDGAVHNPSPDNPYIETFIRYCADKPQLKEYFKIPDDLTSFTAPDMRNQHLVATGDKNVIHTFQTSKIIGISTQTFEWRFDRYIDEATVNRPDGNELFVTPKGAFYTPNQSFLTPIVVDRNKFNDNMLMTLRPFYPPSSGDVPSTVNVKEGVVGWKMDFSKIVDSTTIDTINRVPAFATFLFLDIAVDRLTLSGGATNELSIEISQVIGLQEALNLKVDDTELSTYVTIDDLTTKLNGKANNIHTHIINDITYLQNVLDEKAEILHTHVIGDLKYDNSESLEEWLNSSYSTINHTHSDYASNNTVNALATEIDSMQSIITKLSKKRLFHRIWKTSTAGNIPAGTVTIHRILDRLTYDSTGANVEPIGLTFTATTGTNTIIKELNDVDFPEKSIKIYLRFARATSLGITKLAVGIYRALDNSLVVATSEGITDADERSISFHVKSLSYGALDSYVTGGYYIGVRNLTATALNYDTCQVIIEELRDIGY